MKHCILYLLLVTFLFTQTVAAQTRTRPVQTSTSTQSHQAKSDTQTHKSNNPRPTLSQATDSLKFAVNDFKKSMNSIFASKKDTIQIFIPGIEYDDASLSALKESLKKIRGGRFVNMQYKSSNAILDVFYKGNSTELWDQLPDDSKRAFKIVEMNDNNMTLSVRK